MAACVGADLDTRSRHLAQLGQCIDRKRPPRRYIVRKRFAAQHVVRRNKVRERNPIPQQEGNREAAVVGVAVVERDARRRSAVAARSDAILCIGEAHDIEPAA